MKYRILITQCGTNSNQKILSEPFNTKKEAEDALEDLEKGELLEKFPFCLRTIEQTEE